MLRIHVLKGPGNPDGKPIGDVLAQLSREVEAVAVRLRPDAAERADIFELVGLLTQARGVTMRMPAAVDGVVSVDPRRVLELATQKR